MILDSGLDAACNTTAASNGSIHPAFGAFIHYAAFGSGGTPATVGDLLLEQQIGSRTKDGGGFSAAEDGALDAANNLIWYEAEFTRIFNITDNVTAREWGLALAATGNLSARDLFRDLSNNPTSIPLEDGDQLQLVIKLRVEAAWEYEPASFVITGTAGSDSNGLHTGVATISSGSATNLARIQDALQACWPGGYGTAPNQTRFAAYLQSQAGVAKNDQLNGTPENTDAVMQPYTLTTHYRDWIATFSTSAANGVHYAWARGPVSASNSSGFRFILTDPQTLTKENTHRLVLTLRKHIGRA